MPRYFTTETLDFTRPLTEKQVTGTRFLDLFVDRGAETSPLLPWICGALELEL